MMLKYKSIAVDYDDTLVWENKDTYPHSDNINKFAFEVLKKCELLPLALMG